MTAIASLLGLFLLIGLAPAVIALVVLRRRRGRAPPLSTSGKLIATAGFVLIALPAGCSTFWSGLNLIESGQPKGDFDITAPWVVALSGYALALAGVWVLRRGLGEGAPRSSDPG